MAILILSHETALSYIRDRAFDEAPNRPRPCDEGEANRAMSEAEVLPAHRFRREDVLASIAPGWLPGPSEPVHLLVASRASRRQSSLFVAHVWGGRVPSRSLLRLDAQTYLVSPELLFLQMAVTLSLPRLSLLGLELCGTYALAADDCHGFRRRDAWADASQMRALLEGMHAVRGVHRAREAIRFVQGGAASPMEATVSLLLALPFELGGYGLPRPFLNYRVDWSLGSREGVGQGFYVCDLYWPEYRVAVEYDSDMFHTGSERIAHDSERRNALAYLGIAVVTVTRRQVMSLAAMDRVAAQLRRFLRQPSSEGVSRELFRRRLALRKDLLPR